MERLNGKGMDPLWGGDDSKFQVSGSAEEADEALCRRLCRVLLLGLDAETAATAESRVRRICCQLTSEAAAAAKSLHRKLKAECSSTVSATFDARRGCYLFTLPGSPDSPAIANACSDSEGSGESADEPGGSSEAFAISPSALARNFGDFSVPERQRRSIMLDSAAEHRDRDMAWRGRCNIKRIQWPRGRAMLPLPDEPYVVEVPRNWNTRMRRSLEHDVLLGTMGNVTCTPSQAGSKRIGTFEMTLAQYLQEWLPKPISKNAEDNRYVFGEFGENWAPLRESYNLPPCQVCTQAAAAITIGLGGSFSGAPWHFHNAAFVEVFHGSKHFVFLPPGDPAIEEIETDMQFNASMSQYHWHLERRPEMEASGQLQNLQECLIHSGELLYFPDSWHHGVVNFGKYTAFVSSFINRDLLKQAAPTLKLLRKAAKRAKAMVDVEGSHGRSDLASSITFLQEESTFWNLTFCTLCRYDALFGPGHKEGGGLHAAVPDEVFAALERESLGKLECFASPLLCQKTWHFCSIFKDLDVFFGSLGPFLEEDLDIGTVGGVYEVNPPFVRGLVLRLAKKLLAAFESAVQHKKVLHVFLVLPGLPENRTEEEHALEELLQSRFKVAISERRRRAFTNGLAFKTDRVWPLFAVSTTVALLTSQPDSLGQLTEQFDGICRLWGEVDAGDEKGLASETGERMSAQHDRGQRIHLLQRLPGGGALLWMIVTVFQGIEHNTTKCIPISKVVAKHLAGSLPTDARVLKGGRLCRVGRKSGDQSACKLMSDDSSPGQDNSTRLLVCDSVFFNFAAKQWQPLSRLGVYMSPRHLLYCAFVPTDNLLFIKVGYRAMADKRDEPILKYIEQTKRLHITNIAGAGVFLMPLPKSHEVFKDPARAAEESLKSAIRCSKVLHASPSGRNMEFVTFSSSLEYFLVKSKEGEAREGSALQALTQTLRDFTGDGELRPLRAVAAPPSKKYGRPSSVRSRQFIANMASTRGESHGYFGLQGDTWEGVPRNRPDAGLPGSSASAAGVFAPSEGPCFADALRYAIAAFWRRAVNFAQGRQTTSGNIRPFGPVLYEGRVESASRVALLRMGISPDSEATAGQRQQRRDSMQGFFQISAHSVYHGFGAPDPADSLSALPKAKTEQGAENGCPWGGKRRPEVINKVQRRVPALRESCHIGQIDQRACFSTAEQVAEILPQESVSSPVLIFVTLLFIPLEPTAAGLPQQQEAWALVRCAVFGGSPVPSGRPPSTSWTGPTSASPRESSLSSFCGQRSANTRSRQPVWVGARIRCLDKEEAIVVTPAKIQALLADTDKFLSRLSELASSGPTQELFHSPLSEEACMPTRRAKSDSLDFLMFWAKGSAKAPDSKGESRGYFGITGDTQFLCPPTRFWVSLPVWATPNSASGATGFNAADAACRLQADTSKLEETKSLQEAAKAAEEQQNAATSRAAKAAEALVSSCTETLLSKQVLWQQAFISELEKAEEELAAEEEGSEHEEAFDDEEALQRLLDSIAPCSSTYSVSVSQSAERQRVDGSSERWTAVKGQQLALKPCEEDACLLLVSNFLFTPESDREESHCLLKRDGQSISSTFSGYSRQRAWSHHVCLPWLDQPGKLAEFEYQVVANAGRQGCHAVIGEKKERRQFLGLTLPACQVSWVQDDEVLGLPPGPWRDVNGLHEVIATLPGEKVLVLCTMHYVANWSSELNRGRFTIV
ncbi:Jmjd8, partial [Symbiodinium sp. KB8]